MPRNNKDFHEERVMDYSFNPKTGKHHPIVESGEGYNAAVYTKLNETMKDSTRRRAGSSQESD